MRRLLDEGTRVHLRLSRVYLEPLDMRFILRSSSSLSMSSPSFSPFRASSLMFVMTFDACWKEGS